MTPDILGLDLDRRPRGPRRLASGLVRRLLPWLGWAVLLAGAGWTAFVEITFARAPVDGTGVLAFLALVPYVPYALMAVVVGWLGSSPCPRAAAFVLLGALLMSGSSAAALHVAFASGPLPWSGLAFILLPPAQTILVGAMGALALFAHRPYVRAMQTGGGRTSPAAGS